MVGSSLLAFGAVGGLCHGIAEKTDFRTYHWNKPSNGGGGSRHRIYLPSIDLYLYQNEAEVLLKGKSAKSLLGCNHTCCANDTNKMYEQHRAHALAQSMRLVDRFNKNPVDKWAEFLISKNMEPIGRTLRKIQKIKSIEPKLMEKIIKQSHRLDLMTDTLVILNKTTAEIPLALKPVIHHVDFSSYGRMGR